eukprot:s1549_g8.t1
MVLTRTEQMRKWDVLLVRGERSEDDLHWAEDDRLYWDPAPTDLEVLARMAPFLFGEMSPSRRDILLGTTRYCGAGTSGRHHCFDKPNVRRRAKFGLWTIHHVLRQGPEFMLADACRNDWVGAMAV